jgi:hypothetical protein
LQVTDNEEYRLDVADRPMYGFQHLDGPQLVPSAVGPLGQQRVNTLSVRRHVGQQTYQPGSGGQSDVPFGFETGHP